MIKLRSVFAETPETVHDGLTFRHQLLTEASQKLGAVATYNYAWQEPGTEMSHHQHPDCTEYYFILTGEGEMLIDKEWGMIKSGDLITVPPQTEHSLRTTVTNSKCTFMVLRTH